MGGYKNAGGTGLSGGTIPSCALTAPFELVPRAKIGASNPWSKVRRIKKSNQHSKLGSALVDERSLTEAFQKGDGCSIGAMRERHPLSSGTETGSHRRGDVRDWSQTVLPQLLSVAHWEMFERSLQDVQQIPVNRPTCALWREVEG